MKNLKRIHARTSLDNLFPASARNIGTNRRTQRVFDIRVRFVAYAFLIVCCLSIPAFATQTDITGSAGSGISDSTVTVLPNGNIVVTDPGYDLPGKADVGAVYLYDGATLALISTLTGSTASDSVGSQGVTVLTNGNYVVSSQNWNNPSPGVHFVGAATWCNAATGINGEVSSTNSIIGSTMNDRVGGLILALTNGNYVVSSTTWNNSSTNVLAAGAVTWGNGTGGTVGVVSSANSLVGSSGFDLIGFFGITVLPNGNYVVLSSTWDNPSTAIEDVGAVTWGNGSGGTVGAVSSSNSLVGSTAQDNIGFYGITALTNGNYVVSSGVWDNPSTALANVGAVTWGNGSGGTVGAVSSANSLIGSTEADLVGFIPAKALTNGNYVVSSPIWDNFSPVIAEVGAVTWGNGISGTSGTVSSANSLIGSTANDNIGSNGIGALTNGNYVVNSQYWNNPSPAIEDVGAVTWGNGTSGAIGEVSSANSLIGSTANDSVGNNGVNVIDGATALTNGNYVVISSVWDNPSTAIADVGAVTLGNGSGGTVGAVSSSNSLVGSTTGDQIGGNGVTALTNGNYAVSSPTWDNPAPALADVGAVTWGNGAGGTVGEVSSANSLIGSTANDQVGNSITALTNGNYVVSSLNWDDPSTAITNVGAITWSNGSGGTFGTVSSSNSLIGSTASDSVGSNGVMPLTNGNYVVSSTVWDNPSSAMINVGAVTLGNGSNGTIGAVSNANSLVGSTANDQVGNSITALTNGNYVVSSPTWDNGAINDAGAYSFGNGANGTNGTITDGSSGGNSVVGTVTNGVNTFAFDATRNRVFVGRSASNIVSVLFFNTNVTTDGAIDNPAIYDNGLPNALNNAIIPNGRTVSLNGVSNIGLVSVDCTANLTGGSATNYIVGSVRKNFCAAADASFVYPVGDANDYSPLSVTNTNGTGALTATATDNYLLGLPQTKSLSRYWSLEGAGITTDLTFNYTDADVNGTEAAYKAFKRSASTNITVRVTPSIDITAANTITATSISEFSDWSASAVTLGPTAANVSVSGRVLANNSGLPGAFIVMTDSNGIQRIAQTNSFGHYRFENVEAGGTYVFDVKAKQYSFDSQVVNVNENLTDLNFSAQTNNYRKSLK